MTSTRRITTQAATLILAGLLVACGSSEDPSDSKAVSPSATTSPTTSASGATSGSGMSQEEIQAKIITNAPPKNLTWIVPQAPLLWDELETEPGARQWQIGDEPCVLILDQPSGVGTDKEPDSAQVLAHEVQRMGRSLQATDTPRTVSDDPVVVPNQVVGLEGTTTTRFAHARVDFGGGSEADLRAHRAGDFALIAGVACGRGRLHAVLGGDVADFLKKLASRTAY